MHPLSFSLIRSTKCVKSLRNTLTLFPTTLSISSCAFFWYSGWRARKYRRKDIPLDVVSKPAKNRMKPWARISVLLSAVINKMVNAFISAAFQTSKKRLYNTCHFIEVGIHKCTSSIIDLSPETCWSMNILRYWSYVRGIFQTMAVSQHKAPVLHGLDGDFVIWSKRFQPGSPVINID